MSGLILREERDGVAILTLNRPEVLNALNMAIMVELRRQVDDIAGQPEAIRCVIVRGAGRSFCAGADLKAMDAREADVSPAFKPDTIKRIEALPQPVIMLTHGHCYTGGLELALAADFIVAAESTVFADTHAKLGHFAGWGLTQRLPRRIGVSAAKLMMYTSRHINAAAALAMGLADLVVPDDGREEATLGLAREIAQKSSKSIQWTKRMIDGGRDLSLAEALVFETAHHPYAPLRNTVNSA